MHEPAYKFDLGLSLDKCFGLDNFLLSSHHAPLMIMLKLVLVRAYLGGFRERQIVVIVVVGSLQVVLNSLDELWQVVTRGWHKPILSGQMRHL